MTVSHTETSCLHFFPRKLIDFLLWRLVIMIFWCCLPFPCCSFCFPASQVHQVYAYVCWKYRLNARNLPNNAEKIVEECSTKTTMFFEFRNIGRSCVTRGTMMLALNFPTYIGCIHDCLMRVANQVGGCVWDLIYDVIRVACISPACQPVIIGFIPIQQLSLCPTPCFPCYPRITFLLFYVGAGSA